MLILTLFRINTGQLSLILGLLLISLCLIGFMLVYKAIKNKVMEGASLEQLIQLGKWIVASVALLSITAVVADGFKEREQQMKELEYFDKYKDITLSTEGIEKKWLLADYFATVSPAGSFKDSWTAYKKSLKADYDDYQMLKKKQTSVTITKADSSNTKVLEAKTKIIDSIQLLKFQINEKYKGISTAPSSVLNGFKVDIFYTLDLEKESKPRAEKIYNLLVQKYPMTNFRLAPISKEKNATSSYRIQQNQIRYEPSEADAFKELQAAINGANVLTQEPVAGYSINYYTPNYLSVFISNN